LLILNVVSIIFLPLTFMAQFYSMGVDTFPHNSSGNVDMPLGYATSRVFGIGLTIAASVVGLAFTLNFFMLESTWKRAADVLRKRDGGLGNMDAAERKEVLARTSPGRDTVSVISYHSYDPRMSPTKTTISTWFRSWKSSNGESDREKEVDEAFEP
jgi:hypothetical protein